MTERKHLQNDNTQAALDEYQRDGLIESADWLEDCADCMDDEGLDRDNHARHFRAGANAIRAALTAPDVNAELLEALKEVRDAIRTEGVLNNMKYDALGAKVYQAISRAELTAQLTKTDDNVSCPSVANTGDINTEMLEALNKSKIALERARSEKFFSTPTAFKIETALSAIAHAEAQKVGE